MGFDARLAERVRDELRREDSVREVRMFGGLTFMANGHMCCGVAGNDLVLRLGSADALALIAAGKVRPFQPTGRAAAGMVVIPEANALDAAAFARWIVRALAHASALSSKN